MRSSSVHCAFDAPSLDEKLEEDVGKDEEELAVDEEKLEVSELVDEELFMLELEDEPAVDEVALVLLELDTELE